MDVANYSGGAIMAKGKEKEPKPALATLRPPTTASERGTCVVVYADGSGDVIPNTTGSECDHIAANRKGTPHWIATK